MYHISNKYVYVPISVCIGVLSLFIISFLGLLDIEIA